MYDHCARAIKKGLHIGKHGLPLIGSGDWNDGMDKVGNKGEGESVWLGFFLFEILKNFGKIAASKNDNDLTKFCKDNAAILKNNLDKNAWDGEWYLRAFFDDGTPLGSSRNAECKIDSLSQSWSVLSGAGITDRSKMAMESAYHNLVSSNLSLIQLFEPAFDKTEKNPGYIKGYVPGVRENGGQYTHGAVWLIMAFAQLKDKKRTWELLNMINPILHGSTESAIDIYEVEPYVMAADIYTEPTHAGKGGWTWYTGSASWMYKLIIEYFLGFTKKGNLLELDPCIPEEWEKFSVSYKFGSAVYEIEILQDKNIEETVITIDGVKQNDASLILQSDAKNYQVKIFLPLNKTIPEKAFT